MNKRMAIKTIIFISFILALILNNFAAVVSDNDGSAFITKSEFDSLKNNFQSQIDQYNTSIDSKIDMAIASYLAGISVTKTENIFLDSKTTYSFPIVMMSSSNLWNEPKSSYYNIVRNRVRFTRYDIHSMSLNNAHTLNAVTFSDDSDGSTIEIPGGNENNSVIYGFIRNNGREILGISAPLYYITTSANIRKIGTTNFKVFDINSYGIGYQYIDYKVQKGVGNAQQAGHFTWNRSNKYAYCGVLGLDSGSGRSNPEAYKVNWTETMFKSQGSGWSNATQYDQKTESYLGTKVGLDAIPEWYGHGDGGITYQNIDIDSSSFVWDRQLVKTMLYAGTSMMPAQLNRRFSFSPDFSDGATTTVECVDIQQTGYAQGWAYNPTADEKTSGKFLARTCTYMPPFKCTTYDGYSNTISDLPSFSALPASCVRYYDEQNKVHYMDEGMFLSNFKKGGTADFDVRFGTDTGTKTVNFYVSKTPFDRVNGKTKLAKFKLDKGTTEYTTTSLSTDISYHITVEGMKKGDQLYILWEPTTSGQYVTLEEFSGYKLTSDE